MIYRKEILENCPEEFEEELFDYLDRLEGAVNLARGKLVSIKSVADLHRVEDCLQQLTRISNALY